MQLTVKELIRNLTKAVKENPSIADKHIVVADDNEGNGYHGMFYGLTTNLDSIKEIVEFSGVYDSNYDDPRDIVILG